jgi:hypothetical protein
MYSYYYVTVHTYHPLTINSKSRRTGKIAKIIYVFVDILNIQLSEKYRTVKDKWIFPNGLKYCFSSLMVTLTGTTPLQEETVKRYCCLQLNLY